MEGLGACATGIRGTSSDQLARASAIACTLILKRTAKTNQHNGSSNDKIANDNR